MCPTLTFATALFLAATGALAGGAATFTAKPTVTKAGASDRFIYVGDTLNHRVLRADKTWAAETVCEIN